MTDKKEPLLKEWGWPFARKQRVQKAENNLFPGFEWPSIFDEANEMLLASIMIYALVDLRTLARKGVLSALEEGEDLPNRILTLPVSTREIVRLVSKNRETILDQIGASSTDLYLSAFDSIQDTTARHVVCAETGETILVSSDVVVCDDLNSDTELVYGIWLDSARQRMTVTFRGCTTLTDWTTSTHQYLKSIPNPVTPPEAGSPTDIAIHYGFFAYLNEPGPLSGKPKIEKILSEMKHILQKYPDYKVYITGHSLGAALSTVFSFQAAASAETWNVHLPTPITCINFASPMVGNIAFRRAFQTLERRGRLRCLRVTNSMDMFTKLPDRASSAYLLPCCFPTGPIQYLGLSCLFFMCCQNNIYRHVGMALKFYRHGRYKIKFPREPDNTILLAAQDWKKHLTLPIKMVATLPFTCCGSYLDYGCCCRVEDFGVNHQASAYMDRLQPLSYELQDKYLNDLYNGI